MIWRCCSSASNAPPCFDYVFSLFAAEFWHALPESKQAKSINSGLRHYFYT
ncbi:hypothetical protein J699_01383 [Acinetobacter sp. 1000160]|nr:hypothetical protein J522_1020 [Acinetobacter baumannii 146457]EYT21647.1 hypothetical protein J699_01383 [Acinetobacter sp. 1000160]